MKEVIRINIDSAKTEIPVEFTHCLDGDTGWDHGKDNPHVFDRIVYLGNCSEDGDMFACYYGNVISIYKGYLNSGKY